MEENKTLMPPKEQALETERDAKAEELESTFSYDGYQVVRKELFAHLREKTASHLTQPASVGWKMWFMYTSCSTVI